MYLNHLVTLHHNCSTYSRLSLARNAAHWNAILMHDGSYTKPSCHFPPRTPLKIMSMDDDNPYHSATTTNVVSGVVSVVPIYTYANLMLRQCK